MWLLWVHYIPTCTQLHGLSSFQFLWLYDTLIKDGMCLSQIWPGLMAELQSRYTSSGNGGKKWRCHQNVVATDCTFSSFSHCLPRLQTTPDDLLVSNITGEQLTIHSAADVRITGQLKIKVTKWSLTNSFHGYSHLITYTHVLTSSSPPCFFLGSGVMM